MNNNEINGSLEFLTAFDVFWKQNMIRRLSDLNSKIANSGPFMVLPKNPMLHLLDNFAHSDSSSDTFDLTQYPFIHSKNNIKYLHNFINFMQINEEDLAKFSNRIYRPKLAETLRSFGMANRKFMIPTIKLDTVVTNKNCIIIENYNPLYRIIATNHRPISQYFRYRAIFKAVLNNINNYDRQHFLVIPVPDNFTYVRSNIMALSQLPEIVSSQKLLSTSHFYFFMIDLLSLLLNNECTVSTFNTVNRDLLNRLNIMLIHQSRSIIFNLGKLAGLITSNAYVFHFADTVSRLSGVAVPIVPIEEPSQIMGYVDSPEEDDKAAESPSVGIITNNIVNNPSPAAQNAINNVINTLPRVTTQPSVSEAENDAVPDEDAAVIDHEEREIDQIDAINTTMVEDDVLDRVVVKGQVLSPKQKERIKVLAQKHKTIEVITPTGKKTIEQIINAPVDIKVESAKLSSDVHITADENMLHSSVTNFEQGYASKLLRKDIITNILAFQENGLFLTDYIEKNEYNSFTRIKHVKATFTDVNGKRHTVNFKLPMPDDEGYYLVNGVRLSMSKQLVNIPICKISPTRVSLISNYNKTLVDKVESKRYSFPEILAAKAAEANIKLTPKRMSYVGLDLPYDYKQLGAKYSKITTPEWVFSFEYADRFKNLVYSVGLKLAQFVLNEFEAQFGVLVGRKINSVNEFVFINKQNVCTVVNIESRNILSDNFSRSLPDLLKIEAPNEWCNLKILDKNIPIVFILAYRYGLTKVLKNLKIPYRFVKRGTREKTTRKASDISIEFKDGWLVFDRYPLQNSYILAGFTFFPTLSDYPMIDFDGKDVYYQLLIDKKMSINYLRGIDNYFSFFIDPITKEILEQMHEPTNTRDLLIRAVDMIVDGKDKAPSSIENFRLRSAEKLPAMIYNEIARQYANYVNSNYKDTSFSINTEAIFQRIIQDQTMTLREDRNPIHSMKEISRVTYTGFGGRSSEAFVARDRKYPKDAIGVLAETTTDSGSVGMVGALTADPKIKNLRGMFDTEAADKAVTNMLSDTTLLIPGAVNDDQYFRSY